MTAKIYLRLHYFLFLAAALLLAGCMGTSTLYSNSFAIPTKKITNFKVIYLENKLIGKGSGPVSLAAIGYDDLPELLRERVPIILSLNGISTDYATIPKVNFGQKEAIDSIQWSKNSNPSASLLVLQVIDGSSITTRGSSTIYLNLHANLFDAKTQTRQWTGQFQNTLSKAPLGRIGFDNDFVDQMLKKILEQMAKDGIVLLNGGKASIPESKTRYNEQPRM